MPDLVALQAAVDVRTRAIADLHPSWPCRRGCDDCCRHLAAAPVLTEPEWILVRDATAQLPEETQAVIRRRVQAISDSVRPIVCPILDETSGTCLVYAARPIACRTYGFYVDREGGLYCAKVDDAASSATDVVWGNQEAVESTLDAFGVRLPITEWFDIDRR